MTAGGEQRNMASAFLKKAEEYAASAQDNLDLERHTPAAGDAIHAGINAKDAVVTMLTGSTGKAKDHPLAVKELTRALGRRQGSTAAERALRELLAAKGDVEYGASMITRARAEPLVRRARALVDLATEIVRLGR